MAEQATYDFDEVPRREINVYADEPTTAPIVEFEDKDGTVIDPSGWTLELIVMRNYGSAEDDLSSEVQEKLEGWAAHKYNLFEYLPSDHPFKQSPPTV